VDSYKPGTNPGRKNKELGFDGHKKVLENLSKAKVFHVALGGGESLELPWFFDLADYAAKLKMIPNLTTNGFEINLDNIGRCKVFGQINVSIDGIFEDYDATRGIKGFEKADKGLNLLRKGKCRFGINTVLSRVNFHLLESIIKYAKKKKAGQVELLRFKPSGRGAGIFSEMDITLKQAESFYPKVVRLIKKYRINIRLDCSFMPMVFFHEPNPGQVEFFSVTGCHGGDMLLGIKPDGGVNPCSFASVQKDLNALDFPGWWAEKKTFNNFRRWHKDPPAPCSDCQYLEMCRGGCHVVAKAVAGDLMAPDPGCPTVVRHYDKRK